MQEWLPPGGHVDLNEDPVQTTLREIKEETGFDVEIVPTQKPLRMSNLDQIYAPHSIMIEDVVDSEHGEHQHIDHIYFTRLIGDISSPTGELSRQGDKSSSWLWVSSTDLQSEIPFKTPKGELRTPPEDVLKLGLAAIQHVNGEAFQHTVCDITTFN